MDINMPLLLALYCFACFPLSFGCPRIFCQGSWSWCVSWHFFVFVTLGPAWEQRGNIESVFQGPVPILFSCRMGKRGIMKTWVLSLIPIWIISIFFILKTYSGPCLSSHLNYFHLLKCSSWLQPPNVPFNLPLINVPFELCLFCPLLHNSRQRCYIILWGGGRGNFENNCWLYPEV